MKVYESFDVRYSIGTCETYLNTIYQKYLSVDAFESDVKKAQSTEKADMDFF